MKLQVHLPRRSEAAMQPALEGDITIQPKVYRRAGLVPALHFTVADVHGHEDRYVLLISSVNKQLRLEKLIEVVPACDEPKAKELHDAHHRGQGGDKAAKD